MKNPKSKSAKKTSANRKGSAELRSKELLSGTPVALECACMPGSKYARTKLLGHIKRIATERGNKIINAKFSERVGPYTANFLTVEALEVPLNEKADA